MATLGSAGKNSNFAPAFTVPGGMTLDGYAVGGPAAGTPWYRSVDSRIPIPASKVAAVQAAMTAQGIARYKLNPSRAWPWSPNGGDYNGFRIYCGPPATWLGTVLTWDAAKLTAVLAALNTAITT